MPQHLQHSILVLLLMGKMKGIHQSLDLMLLEHLPIILPILQNLEAKLVEGRLPITLVFQQRLAQHLPYLPKEDTEGKRVGKAKNPADKLVVII